MSRHLSKSKLGKSTSRPILSSPAEQTPVYTGSVYGNIFHHYENSPTRQKSRKNLLRVPHSFIYTMLNSKSRQRQAVIFKNVMAWIILSDVAFFVISTEPGCKKNPIFYQEEGIVSCFFLLEYMIRLCTITESHKYGALGPLKGRLKYMISFHAIIDAFATFPFFLELLTDGNLPTLTYLRFFRLMRILRTDPLGKAIDSLQRVLFYNREILYVAGVMAMGLIMFTAVLMYYLRPRENGADPQWSIATTMYYSTLMLTGQGGPEGDLPWYTKSVVLLTGLFSIGMFAIPASMLTWGFEAEAARVASNTRKRHLRTLAGESAYSSSSSSSSSFSDDGNLDSVDSSDEEYMKLIAGEEADGEGSDTAVEESLKEILSVVSSHAEAGSSAEMLVRMNKLEEKVDQILQMLQGDKVE